jgi:hypothetical protein
MHPVFTSVHSHSFTWNCFITNPFPVIFISVELYSRITFLRRHVNFLHFLFCTSFFALATSKLKLIDKILIYRVVVENICYSRLLFGVSMNVWNEPSHLSLCPQFLFFLKHLILFSEHVVQKKDREREHIHKTLSIHQLWATFSWQHYRIFMFLAFLK